MSKIGGPVGVGVISESQVLEHCRLAAEIVSKWPKWKQNLIENSLKPSWDTPRKPIQPITDRRADILDPIVTDPPVSSCHVISAR